MYTCLIALFYIVQQSSLFGLAGILSNQKYTQALMAGESVAGLVVVLIRIVTKATLRNGCVGVLIFFGIALGFILFCVLCHLFLIKSPYVKRYLEPNQQNVSTVIINVICVVIIAIFWNRSVLGSSMLV